MDITFDDELNKYDARPHAEVIKDMQAIVDKVVAGGGLLIGHAFEKELNMLRGVNFDSCRFRDTQLFSGYRKFARSILPSLEDCHVGILGTSIQSKGHCSIRDSRATRKLYNLNKDDIDREQAGWIIRAHPASMAGLSTAATDESSSPTHSTEPSPVSSPAVKLTSIYDLSATHTIMAAKFRDRVYVGLTSPYPPGYVVALPDIPSIGKGRVFDKRTSTYC